MTLISAPLHFRVPANNCLFFGNERLCMLDTGWLASLDSEASGGCRGWRNVQAHPQPGTNGEASSEDESMPASRGRPRYQQSKRLFFLLSLTPLSMFCNLVMFFFGLEKRQP